MWLECKVIILRLALRKKQNACELNYTSSITIVVRKRSCQDSRQLINFIYERKCKSKTRIAPSFFLRFDQQREFSLSKSLRAVWICVPWQRRALIRTLIRSCLSLVFAFFCPSYNLSHTIPLPCNSPYGPWYRRVSFDRKTASILRSVTLRPRALESRMTVFTWNG